MTKKKSKGLMLTLNHCVCYPPEQTAQTGKEARTSIISSYV